MNDIKFTDNSDEVLKALNQGVKNALEAIGENAEKHAKETITKAGRVDTGTLRNSISHKQKEDSVYIGTSVEYAPYIEFGTGIYASNGAGRKDPWVYVDEKGNFHFTRGIKPTHFLKNAATQHTPEYKKLAEEALKNT